MPARTGVQQRDRALRDKESLMRFSLLGSQAVTLRTEFGRAGFNHALTRLADLKPDPQALFSLPQGFQGRDATLVITASDYMQPVNSSHQIKVFDVRDESLTDLFHEARALPSRSRLAHLEQR